MRTLHVAALPFPSPQGTQALLHQMLSALAAAGHDTHLLCYAHGTGVLEAAYEVHRSATRSLTRSLRSGPSLDKVRLDVALAIEVTRLVRRLSPSLVVAHHVEAALATLSVRAVPRRFVAHTSLSAELPTYGSNRFAGLLAESGKQLDRFLLRSTRSFAVSPLLAERLTRESDTAVRALPLPWPVPTPITEAERMASRREMGFADGDAVLLYAGNLDAYQGLDEVLPALRSRPLVIATQSPHELAMQGADVRFVPLRDEQDRRLAYAAADCALVPRRSEGGIPVKLLDAFARGVPVVAARRALAGHDAAAHCEVVEDRGDWSRAVRAVLEDRAAARARAREAREWVLRTCTAERFVRTLLSEAEQR